jgi:hypothetical protein
MIRLNFGDMWAVKKPNKDLQEQYVSEEQGPCGMCQTRTTLLFIWGSCRGKSQVFLIIIKKFPKS